MRYLTLLLIALLPIGCISTQFDFGEAHLKTTRLGTQTRFGKITLQQGTNKFMLEGYTSDQVESLKAVAEGTAKGLAQGIK